MNADDFSELFARREDLDPELKPYLDSAGPLGPCIRHPLVYSIVHNDALNAYVNLQFQKKSEAVHEARQNRSWETYVYLHERPYRLMAFRNICRELKDRQYWELLGNIYTDTENFWQERDGWIECLTVDRKARTHLMDAAERARKNSLPARITAYRGYCEDGQLDGISWTLDPSVAQFFATRLAQTDQDCFIATTEIRKRDVIAYFDGRNEDEIVVLPEDALRNVAVRKYERNK